MDIGQTANLDGFLAETPRLTAWEPRKWPVAADWAPTLASFLASDAAARLAQYITKQLSAGAVIYPAQPLRALQTTPLAQVRVVILGQDPYHGPGQAEGLAFSVAPGIKPPPSLRNIYKELASSYPVAAVHASDRAEAVFPLPANPQKQGSLLPWAERGVLLLNTVLTVEDGKPASHAQKGWEALTDAIIVATAQKCEPVVFMLWGAHAQSKRASIVAQDPNGRHLVLTANHPSPLSALRPPHPFLGCAHFEKAMRHLAG